MSLSRKEFETVRSLLERASRFPGLLQRVPGLPNQPRAPAQTPGGQGGLYMDKGTKRVVKFVYLGINTCKTFKIRISSSSQMTVTKTRTILD